ncbi:MAG: 3'-5' exonuclease [Pseudomonadota bacterium]
MSPSGENDHDQAEQLARRLEQNTDFRVLRRLAERTHFAEPDGRALLKGAIVDTETTGLDKDADRIIEFAMIIFEFDPASGQVFRITDIYDELEDPGMPIPAASTAVHGITDEMVAGKHIDDVEVEALLQDVSLVIAHNAQFDRPFLEDRLPVFVSLPWGCSFQQVNWADEGLGSAKLEYLAYRLGFFFDAHRAQADCLALLEILQRPLPASGGMALTALLLRAAARDYRVYAIKAPFDSKELLKARAYRWDGDKKCWHKTLEGGLMKDELAWLKQNVYGGRSAQLEFETLDAFCRFSSRPGKVFPREI